jgi:hypothetical protein
MNVVKRMLILFVVLLLGACQSAATATPAPTATPKPQPTATVQPAEPAAQAGGPFDGWVAFTSDDGNFRILLPTKPELQSQQVDTAAGTSTVNIYMTSVASGAYGVMYNDFSTDAVKKGGAKDMLASAMDGAAKKVGGKLAGSREIEVAGNPGVDFAVQMPVQSNLPDGGIYASRIFLAGDRLYQIIAVQAGKGDQALVSAFFDSFSLTK